MTQPILVCMSWRGGARFERCLSSLSACIPYFKRVIISVTSSPGSDDMIAATRFQDENPGVEVICTGQELPTMRHQRFWIEYAVRTGARPDDWVCWLAYDDELRLKGLKAVTDENNKWHLDLSSTYFGPWAMRHEGADVLWAGDPFEPLEAWTSFPIDGPLKLRTITWVAQQLIQPSYIQMSGSLAPLRNHAALVTGHSPKQGPMRIEMATAIHPGTPMIQELTQPITIIYGRPNSDRANYRSTARHEDWDLARRMVGAVVKDPATSLHAAALLARHLTADRGSQQEAWVSRFEVVP